MASAQEAASLAVTNESQARALGNETAVVAEPRRCRSAAALTSVTLEQRRPATTEGAVHGQRDTGDLRPLDLTQYPLDDSSTSRALLDLRLVFRLLGNHDYKIHQPTLVFFLEVV